MGGTDHRSTKVWQDSVIDPVQSHGSAVEQDPLLPGVTEWHPHADHGIRVASTDLFTDDVGLIPPVPLPLRGPPLVLRGTCWRAGNQ